MSTFSDFFLDFLLSSFYQNKPFLNYPTKYSKTKIEIFCQLCQPSNNFSSDSRRLECERLLGTKDLLISPLMVSIKTFTENQYSKRHLMDLSWHIQRLWLKKYSFFRNKTFFVFQYRKLNLFEKEFRETSQKFNSIKQLIEKMKITTV